MEWETSVMNISNRLPDVTIGKPDIRVYRWFIIPRNPIFNIYYHKFVGSDDDRALHDHMYFNISILVKGSYFEHRIKSGGVHTKTLHKAGTLSGIIFRSPWTAHRIEILEGTTCETIFITGPRIRRWGFHCPKGWRYWKDFGSSRSGDDGINGRGCD